MQSPFTGFIAVDLGDGTTYAQRPPPLAPSEPPLDPIERAVLSLCDTLETMRAETRRLRNENEKLKREISRTRKHSRLWGAR